MKNIQALAANMVENCLDYYPVSGVAYDTNCDYLYATVEGIFLIPAAAWNALDSTNEEQIVTDFGTRICDSW